MNSLASGGSTRRSGASTGSVIRTICRRNGFVGRGFTQLRITRISTANSIAVVATLSSRIS